MEKILEALNRFSIPVCFRQFLTNEIPEDRITSTDTREAMRQAFAGLFGDRVHYQRVPEQGSVEDESHCAGGPGPYIWFRQGGTDSELCLDGDADELPDEITLDVEVWSTDPAISEVGERLLTRILHNYGGRMGSPFGAILVQDIVVSDHDDDYTPFGFVDFGNFNQSFQVSIFPFKA